MIGKAAILGIKNDQTSCMQTPSKKLPMAIFCNDRQQSNYTHYIQRS